MASDGRNSATVTAINAAISSIYPADNLYTPPEERKWKVYWTRYWCFKSQKREKRIVPAAARSEGASGSVREWPTAQAGLGLVPPSSPASFVNSTVQSPASFTLSLSAVSASMCSPGRPNTMFTIGPYAHETQLVSPPVFSTFTTEPSTAPFTPPPELAHLLTTPSSPDVPFARYITSSVEAKRATRETISPLSTSTLASPCDTPVSNTPTSSHYYLGSPVGRLISPTLGYSSGEVISFENHPLYSSAFLGKTVSSFPTYDPFASANLDGVPFAAFILPNDTISRCEEQPAPLLVEHEVEHEDWSHSSHMEVNEHCTQSSCKEEVGEVPAHEHGARLLQEAAGEMNGKLQVELDLQSDQGTRSGNTPLKFGDKEVNDAILYEHDGHSLHEEEVGGISVHELGACISHEEAGEILQDLPVNQDVKSASMTVKVCTLRVGGSVARAKECVRKGEKLQELFANEPNEPVFLQHDTEQDVKLPSRIRDNSIEPFARKDSQIYDGGCASKLEVGLRASLCHCLEPLQQVDVRPVLFELDEIS